MDANAFERGDFDHRISSDHNLSFFKWMDNKVVHVASNYHRNDSSRVLRTQKDGTKKHSNVPRQLLITISTWWGMDLHDMLIVAHGIGRK